MAAASTGLPPLKFSAVVHAAMQRLNEFTVLNGEMKKISSSGFYDALRIYNPKTGKIVIAKSYRSGTAVTEAEKLGMIKFGRYSTGEIGLMGTYIPGISYISGAPTPMDFTEGDIKAMSLRDLINLFLKGTNPQELLSNLCGKQVALTVMPEGGVALADDDEEGIGGAAAPPVIPTPAPTESVRRTVSRIDRSSGAIVSASAKFKCTPESAINCNAQGKVCDVRTGLCVEPMKTRNEILKKDKVKVIKDAYGASVDAIRVSKSAYLAGLDADIAAQMAEYATLESGKDWGKTLDDLKRATFAVAASPAVSVPAAALPPAAPVVVVAASPPPLPAASGAGGPPVEVVVAAIPAAVSTVPSVLTTVPFREIHSLDLDLNSKIAAAIARSSSTYGDSVDTAKRRVLSQLSACLSSM